MGKLWITRIKEKGAKGDGCYEYKNEINIKDINSIVALFQDLVAMYGAPIEKAIKLLGKTKENIFPFSPEGIY